MVILLGCQVINRAEVRKTLLKKHVITGQIIPGSYAVSSVNKKSDFDRKPGIYLLNKTEDYNYYHSLLKKANSAPITDFTNRIYLLVIVGASDYTKIHFHQLIDGSDGEYHAYFLVDRQPVESSDETYAFCLLELPRIYGELNIEFIYLREDLYTGYVIEETGMQKSYVFER